MSGIGSVVDYQKRRGIDASSAFKQPMFPPAQPSASMNQMSYTNQEGSSLVSNADANLTQVVWGTQININDVQ